MTCSRDSRTSRRTFIANTANMRVTNAAEANQHLTREYRAGWNV